MRHPPIDGATYDAAGNLLNDGAGGHTFTYDAENRITSVTSASGTATYSYDAFGHRVHRTGAPSPDCDSTGIRDFVYDLSGRWIFQTAGNGAGCDYEIYVGSRAGGAGLR